MTQAAKPLPHDADLLAAEGFPVGEARAPAPRPVAAPRVPETPAFDLIELFFFAYRDFVGDPDRILADYGFGRAHHRVIHFVSRHPGLTIAELLDILKITKQSLNRVLKELIEKGFVDSRPGTLDRRQRLLYVTEAGAELTRRLAGLQSRRIRAALAEAPEGAREAVARFLTGMIDPADRAAVARRIAERGPDQES